MLLLPQSGASLRLLPGLKSGGWGFRPGQGDTLRLLTVLESPVRDWAKQAEIRQVFERCPYNTIHSFAAFRRALM